METTSQSENQSAAFLQTEDSRKEGNSKYEDEFISYSYSWNDREVSLDYTLKTSSDITIGLYDIQGRQHSGMQKAYQSNGNYQRQFSLDKLPAGEYLLRITAGNKIYGEKILKR